MKKNIEKTLYILINLISIGIFAMFIFLNNPRYIEISNPINLHVYIVKEIYIISAFFVLAYISGFFACQFVKSKTDELCNAYQKRHENISIEKDNNDAKISALEAKIATLEVALEQALRKNK